MTGPSPTGPKAGLSLHDLLVLQGVAPTDAVVMRHVAETVQLRRQLPWFAAEDREAFDAFQSLHAENTSRSVRKKRYLVSAIVDGSAALFTGLYAVGDERPMTRAEWESIPANRRLVRAGAHPPADDGAGTSWFDLTPDERMSDWIGRLRVTWPGGRAYTRLIRPELFKVLALHEEPQLGQAPPDSASLKVTWAELHTIPRSWWHRLSQWRGIYFIRHQPSGKGYVGSAYGQENIAQRWQEYRDSGHGGNVELRALDPEDLTFSVLELVAPTADATSVIQLEQSWKLRLSTARPDGLNAN